MCRRLVVTFVNLLSLITIATLGGPSAITRDIRSRRCCRCNSSKAIVVVMVVVAGVVVGVAVA